ncbi:hypothetical protein CDL15_Pgr014027 [Punica granatum]|uniref:N-acetyltransferase domain-containing protein n=1 Tax=Punica granatum TaxID=22663 RepID=A0A218WA85_PUNGR|nr:hypothetical protein CDL15_Pgr014027 [Punica granatum]
MSVKVAAAEDPVSKSWVAVGEVTKVAETVVVREYEEERDKAAVEAVERLCEVGQRGRPALVTDLLGDPVCRIRHFPLHIMLVAEWGEGGEIVGVIRGCIKSVTRSGSSDYVKAANILGLRVSPTHRRLGIGLKLVQELEEWSKRNGAECAYMATDSTNGPSISLFTKKCEYMKLRTPTVLVQPVHVHRKPLSSGTAIVRLPPKLAESIYRRIFAKAEFFPEDIDTVLGNKLNLGTFMAIPKKHLPIWDPKTSVLPPSFAILSIWNTKEVFKFQVKGVSRIKKACCLGSRKIDSMLPYLKIPSFPNVFRQFGIHFLYGLHMEGKDGSTLMKSLCSFAHNMATDDVACGALVAEVGLQDPVRAAVPHWRRLSWSEDFWCIKKLGGEGGLSRPHSDWMYQIPAPVLFVDPRDV